MGLQKWFTAWQCQVKLKGGDLMKGRVKLVSISGCHPTRLPLIDAIVSF